MLHFNEIKEATKVEKSIAVLMDFSTSYFLHISSSSYRITSSKNCCKFLSILIKLWSMAVAAITPCTVLKCNFIATTRIGNIPFPNSYSTLYFSFTSYM